MKIRNNIFILIIIGSLLSLVALILSKLTGQWINGNLLTLTPEDAIYIVLAGVAFAIYMKTVNAKQI